MTIGKSATSTHVADTGGLRLTERGIAAILVAGMMIIVAAATVVGLTAWRVTSDNSSPLTSYSHLP